MKKLLFNWKYITLFIVLILLTLYMVYSIYFIQYFNFNTKSSIEGYSTEKLINMKNEYLWGNLRFDLNYSGYNGIKYRVVLATIIGTVFILSILKKRLIKYNIGRNSEYHNEINKLKYKLAFVTPVFSLFMVILILAIGFIFSSDKTLGINWENTYHRESFLSGVINPLAVLTLTEVMSFIGLYIISILSYEIVDRFDVFRGIAIIFIVYLLLPIIISYIPLGIKNISLSMPSFLISFNNYVFRNPLNFILIALLYVGVIFWMRKLDDKNVEVD